MAFLEVNFCYDERGGGMMDKLKKYAGYAGWGILGGYFGLFIGLNIEWERILYLFTNLSDSLYFHFPIWLGGGLVGVIAKRKWVSLIVGLIVGYVINWIVGVLVLFYVHGW